MGAGKVLGVAGDASARTTRAPAEAAEASALFIQADFPELTAPQIAM
jgi:hypothetical protein